VQCFVALLSLTLFCLFSVSPMEPKIERRVAQSMMKVIANVVCQFDLRHYAAKLFWKQPNGQPYGSL
jgi:uncharacterized protein YigE (DUF2233 family)